MIGIMKVKQAFYLFNWNFAQSGKNDLFLLINVNISKNKALC